MLQLPREAPPSQVQADALDARKIMSEMIRRQQKLIGGLLVAVVALSLAFAALMPLKQEKPYVIEVNKATGEVSVPAQQSALAYSPSEDSLLFFARRWLRALLSIQPQLNASNEAMALAMLRGDAAISKHKQYRLADKTFERIAREPTLVRDVAVNSISVVPGNGRNIVANVTLTTSSRAGTQTERYLVTMFYELLPPQSRQDRELHPIGFYVTDFTLTAQQ